MKSAETETPMGPALAEMLDLDRGPAIKGSRITVYDVLDYALACWPPDRIAALFRLRTDQVEAAAEYICAHKIEVLREYLKILERCERGNPPELQAKIDARHQKFLELVEQVKQVQERAKTEIHELIQKHRSDPERETVNATDHGGQ